MLEANTVLITIFTRVDDFCKDHQEIKPGPAAKLSDSEIITINLFCELAGKRSNCEHMRFVEQWLRDYFPNIIDRSRYQHRLVKLTRLINDVRVAILNNILMELSDNRILDSTPLPVVTFQRACYTPLFPEAAFGKCAARKMTYYGFKLHLLVDGQGIPMHFDLAPANVSDVAIAAEMLEFNSQEKTVLADKGYISKEIQEKLLQNHGIDLLTPSRRNQKVQLPKAESKLLNRLRQRIEVVNNILKDQFGCEKTYAKTLLGLIIKINSKLAALTFGIFLNKLFGRRLLDIVSIVA
jgi:hypothetical protein